MRLFAYTRDVYELENNFSAILRDPPQLGSFKSFYDTAVSYPSPFAASIERKLIKASGECELQLQETRASRSRVDREGENSALRIPQSRSRLSPRAYRCGNAKRDSVVTRKFDACTMESYHDKSVENKVIRAAVNGSHFDVSRR